MPRLWPLDQQDGKRPEILVWGLDSGSTLEEELAAALECRFRAMRPAWRDMSDEGSGSDLRRGFEEVVAVFVVAVDSVADKLTPHVHRLRQEFPDVPLILATEGGPPERIVDLLALGVDDFVVAPFQQCDLLPRIWRLARHLVKQQDSIFRLKTKLGCVQMVGCSSAFRAVVEKIPVLARCDATVLVGGETGTGKEVCARMIHYLSLRAERQFVPVNCGAIPDELVENELFGHERAAYTGAAGARDGLVREAEGGTLFLDEIDSLSAAAQVKLLRFLQEKEYRPLGSTRIRIADVRVIAATNADFELAVRQGRLREDLYYRLNVLPLDLPPLRERLEDIPLLARHFLVRYAHELGRPVPELSENALEALLLYRWPGNVRELEHVVESAVVLGEGRLRLRRAQIQLRRTAAPRPEPFRQVKARMVARFERSYVEKMLLAHHGNISHAALAAGKNRRAFFELMRKHGVDASRFRHDKP